MSPVSIWFAMVAESAYLKIEERRIDFANAVIASSRKKGYSATLFVVEKDTRVSLFRDRAKKGYFTTLFGVEKDTRLSLIFELSLLAVRAIVES